MQSSSTVIVNSVEPRKLIDLCHLILSIVSNISRPVSFQGADESHESSIKQHFLRSAFLTKPRFSKGLFCNDALSVAGKARHHIEVHPIAITMGLNIPN